MRPLTARSAIAATVWVVTVLLAAGAGAWAGRTTFLPPALEEAQDAVPTFTVVEATVGRSMTLPVTVEWPVVSRARVGGAGTVTSVDVRDGDMVASGDALLTVDLRPAVVMEGDVPAFRDVTIGAKGADVRQLQVHLYDEGYLAASPSGEFGSSTSLAVRAWHKELGLPDDGVVHASDILFVPELPARVRVADGLEVGSPVAPGAELVEVLARKPALRIELNADQATLVPSDRPVEVEVDDERWDAVVANSQVTGEGVLQLDLAAPDGGSVCDTMCDRLDVVTGNQIVNGEVVVVPETSGPSVPVAALMTDADGATYVVSEDGTKIDVVMRSQGDGHAVVDGVEIGTVLRLFGDAS